MQLLVAAPALGYAAFYGNASIRVRANGGNATEKVKDVFILIKVITIYVKQKVIAP